MSQRRLISSMFVRRLLLLMSLAVAVTAMLTLQLVRLSVVHGADNLSRAEARLDRRVFLPTTRGGILDRKGRVLAQDSPSYDIAIEYRAITGAWAIEQATAAVRDRIGPTAWDQMGPEARQAAIDGEVPVFDARVEALYAELLRLGGMDRTELDDRLDTIRRQVERMGTAVWGRRQALELAKHRAAGKPGEPRVEREKIREERQAHVVLPRVPDDVAFFFRRYGDAEPGLLEVQDSTQRFYPWSDLEVVLDRTSLPRPLRSSEPARIPVIGVADHIVGAVRSTVPAEAMARRPFRPESDLGGYRVGDVSGQRGLEAVFEDHLRGTRGVVHTRIDTGAVQRTEPVPGNDIQLTLDIELQALVQAIMSPEFGLAAVQQWQLGWNSDGTPKVGKLSLGYPLNGAAVVVEVDSGDIMAMVSMPTIAMGNLMPAGRREIDQPYTHRVVETPYPPGSIIKPLVLCAAVGEGVHDLDHHIDCTGHYLPDAPDQLRCWIYRPRYGMTTHTAQYGGPLDAIQALARSCNIYFYSLGDELGLDALCRWYRRFGLGTRLDVGLLEAAMNDDGTTTFRGELVGDLPSEEGISERRASGRARPESIMMAIGQGPVTWTPVQAANAYATIARGGVGRDATLLARDPRETNHRRPVEDMRIRPDVISSILEGLRQSVTEPYGTGSKIRYADGSTDPLLTPTGVRVWAKTGTAQAPAMRIDTDGDGWPDGYQRDIDHAWFVGLVGADQGEASRPAYAIAVVIEYGGSGGRTAGPVADQIIHALQRLGYLPAGDGT